jgi:hypothetical protein
MYGDVLQNHLSDATRTDFGICTGTHKYHDVVVRQQEGVVITYEGGIAGLNSPTLLPSLSPPLLPLATVGARSRVRYAPSH